MNIELCYNRLIPLILIYNNSRLVSKSDRVLIRSTIVVHVLIKSLAIIRMGLLIEKVMIRQRIRRFQMRVIWNSTIRTKIRR